MHKIEWYDFNTITILTNGIVRLTMDVVTRRAEEKVTFTLGVGVKVTFFVEFVVRRQTGRLFLQS